MGPRARCSGWRPRWARSVRGGVLLALPALLATGLLRFTGQMYSLPQGYYGIDSIFLLLALMALARIPSMEQLRYTSAHK